MTINHYYWSAVTFFIFFLNLTTAFVISFENFMIKNNFEITSVSHHVDACSALNLNFNLRKIFEAHSVRSILFMQINNNHSCKFNSFINLRHHTTNGHSHATNFFNLMIQSLKWIYETPKYFPKYFFPVIILINIHHVTKPTRLWIGS